MSESVIDQPSDHLIALRIMALHALAYCERLFYLEEAEALVIVPAGGSLGSKSEAFGHCKSYALRATLLHSSLTGGRNYDQGPDAERR